MGFQIDEKGGRNMRLLLIAAVVTAFLALGGTALASPPNSAAAQHVCAAQGGILLDFGTGYACLPTEGRTFSQTQLHVAASICTHAYGGRFVPPREDEFGNVFPYYSCFTSV